MPLYAQVLVVSHVNAKAAMQRFTKSFCCNIDQNKMCQCSIHHNNYRVSFEINANFILEPMFLKLFNYIHSFQPVTTKDFELKNCCGFIKLGSREERRGNEP